MKNVMNRHEVSFPMAMVNIAKVDFEVAKGRSD
jgi:hypothetical protein